MLNYKHYAQGGYTPRCGSADAINPDKGATSSSLSAGVVWGDGYCPLLHGTSIVNFISREKEFSGAIKCFFGIINSS